MEGTHSFKEAVRTIFIQVADLTTAIVCEEPDLNLQVDQATKKFLVEEALPDIQVRAAWGDLAGRMAGEKIFDSGALWQLYRTRENYVFRFASPLFGPEPYKVAQFQPDFARGEVFLCRHYFASGAPVYPLEYPLGELLMVNLLAQGRGVELHGFGMVDSRGEGHLFLGPSGAGKTTMARLWQRAPGVEILNDDRIVLRQVGGRLWMYGTPWHGEGRLASRARAPLTRIYFLSHGMRNLLVPVKNAEAVGRLFTCGFPAFYSATALDFVLSFLEAVVQVVPCHELHFLPDQTVVEFLHGAWAA